VLVARRSVRVTDAQWAQMERHLPRPRRSRTGGRPRISHRDVIDGILWVLKTGARWRDLPDGYPSGATCWRRMREWDEDGTWLALWRAFLGELDARGRLRWENAFIDGSFAAAKKGALTSARRSGERVRSGWWWSTVRVFRWEYMSPRPAPGKSRSSRPP
jgi:transposase